MYTLKPVIALPEQIPLPKVMYELPKIQVGETAQPKSAGESFAQDVQRQKVDPEINMLEARQMKILYQLSDLRAQIEYLCCSVRLADVVKSETTQSNVKNPVHAELILYANPASPPYSVLGIQRIWKDTKFNIEFHRHSTVNNAQSTDLFEQKVLANSKNNGGHNIDLKIIWKDVPDVQLVTRVYDYPFEGEANVLRYLTRLIKSYQYEDPKQATESNLVDTILDLCLKLAYEEPKNVNAITSKFSSHVGKNPWLLNSKVPSIIDVAVWSIIKRVASNRLPKEMKNWYDLCEKTFLSS